MILSEEYLLRKIENSYFLLPVGQRVTNCEKVYRINESTFTILSLLMEEKSEEKLLDELSDIYCVTHDEMADFRIKVGNVLLDLENKGIIVTNLFTFIDKTV